MLDPVLVLLSPVPFPLPSHRRPAGAPPLRSADRTWWEGYEKRERRWTIRLEGDRTARFTCRSLRFASRYAHPILLSTVSCLYPPTTHPPRGTRHGSARQGKDVEKIRSEPCPFPPFTRSCRALSFHRSLLHPSFTPERSQRTRIFSLIFSLFSLIFIIKNPGSLVIDCFW